MSFDWKEYFNLGIVLQGIYPQNFTKEAANRCSISKIYYSCYHIALDYAKSRSYSPYTGNQSGRNHSDVRKWYQNNHNIGVSNWLADLHTWRKLCDYEDNVTNLGYIVTHSVDTARKIFNAIP